MIIGIDAYHDPSKVSSSWCGFVASLDRECTKWFSDVARQEPHVELANSLRLMLCRALENYKKVRKEQL